MGIRWIQLNPVYTFSAMAASTKPREGSYSGVPPIRFLRRNDLALLEIALSLFPILELFIESIN
jgi:hypothetical protein